MSLTGPTTFYHRDGRSKIVRDDHERAALGEDWADSPAAFYASALEEFQTEPVAEPVSAPVAEPDVCGRSHADGRVCVGPVGHRGAHTYRSPS